MIFQSANVKSVKADLAKGEITISLTVGMDEQPTAEELARYVDVDAGDVRVQIVPRQMAFKDVA